VAEEHFGTRVRRAIAARYGPEKEGWFADQIGMSRNQLSRALNGRVGVRPHPETILKIANGLGRSPWEVLAWSVEDVFGPRGEDDPTLPGEDAVFRDVAAMLKEVADDTAIDELRRMRAEAPRESYLAAVRILVSALASNVNMGVQMYLLPRTGPGDPVGEKS
jgi:transcriptional regulator with XRE-family HTH domain